MTLDFPVNSRLFLTGGTGFFGKWLLHALGDLNAKSARTCPVVVLSRNPDQFLSEFSQFSGKAWLSFVRGDLVDFVYPEGSFTHVIHAAIDSSGTMNQDPLGWYEHDLAGTRRILEFAVKCGAGKFLLTSSGAVYGKMPPGLERIPETYPGSPDPSEVTSVYGQAKRHAEQLCALYHGRHGLEATVARCFAFVGEYLPLDGNFAIGNFIRDALYSDAIRVKGDGSPVRSYLYGKDLAYWLLHILLHGQPAHPYNVGSDEPYTIAELAALVGAVLAPEKPILIEKNQPDNPVRSRYVPDIHRVRTELGLEVMTPLRQAITQTASASKPK